MEFFCSPLDRKRNRIPRRIKCVGIKPRGPDEYRWKRPPFASCGARRVQPPAGRRRVDLTIDNGANLNNVREELLEGIVRYRLRRLTVSIDGATPDTYKRYRAGGDFRTVLANIRKINQYKLRRRSRRPESGVLRGNGNPLCQHE